MASNYPTSLDSFTNPSAGNTLDSPSHSLQHSDINDAVEALETKIGIGDSPAGSATSGQVLTAQGGGTAIWATPDAGLVLIDTQSFSAVSSFSFANNTFSSNYENYRILLYLTAASANSNLLGRLRASGSDDSNNVYIANQMNVTTSTVAGGQTASTYFDFRFYNTTTRTIHSFDLFMPNLAENTHYVDTYYTYNDSGAYQAGLHGGVFRADTVFDSFSIITGSGTISGVARCYGYKD